MVDPRVVEHAKVLVNYCCKVKKGDGVVVLASSEAKPLVQQIAGEVGRAGGSLLVISGDASIERAHLLAASDDVAETTPKTWQKLLEGSDVLIQIMSDSNTRELSDVPPAKLMLQARAWAPLLPVIEKQRWNVTLHPTAALAQQAGKSLEAFSDFVYGAILVDWPAMREKMLVLADRMAKTSVVRVVGRETDVTFSIAGRRPKIDSGDNNLPAGEVFTSPVEDSANGTVYFDKPIMYMGSEIRGVRLRFKDGSIIDHSAESGGELLEALLNTDPGAKRLGELGIGMNRGIADFSKNTLFDEKMGDSIHMAVGLGFAELGGQNQSGIHVDMIKGMKDGGAIYFDGAPIYADGKFVWE